MAARSLLLGATLVLAVSASDSGNHSKTVQRPQDDTPDQMKSQLKDFADIEEQIEKMSANGKGHAAAPHKFMSGRQAAAPSWSFKLNGDSPRSLGDTEKIMEQEITDLMLGKGALAGTPQGGSVAQIKRIITKKMIPKVVAAHKFDQKQLHKLVSEINRCGKIKTNWLKLANVEFQKYRKHSRLHKKCRSDEAVKFTSMDTCKKEQKSLFDVKRLRCKAFATISRQVGTTQSNAVIIKKGGGETVENYVKRLSKTFCGRHVHGPKGEQWEPGGWGGGLEGGFLDKYLKSKEACKVAQREWMAKVKECKRKIHAYNVRRAACNQFQTNMDSSSCKRAVSVKDGCEAYAGCYFNRLKAYRNLEKKVKWEEMDRRAEWRGLKRMECLISAFADGRVSNDEVDSCKAKSHDTTHLIIEYPKVPKLGKCTIPKLYPATGAYKRAEFAPLPALARGKESQECTGVQEVSLTPFQGSPKSCKCRRVTLNGHYQAGALVKCTDCADVKNSRQRSSCPKGSKIFSPASRDDWKTFLSSARPLRAPHWIIDVTRPQNGCGGCTKNPMNSDNKAQVSWVTADGTPWWLRSTRYNEPNGDYNANCYMDLWRKPTVNNVQFNDGRCNYHAKSYYCQPKKEVLKPRKGSPHGCKCKKVVLTGPYTPGALVKCEQCLTVYKSTQKNSCPEGMKIFAPTSRADWKTFLGSAGPLRAPYFIIDITRPQNGCGGCTGKPMKSTSPTQASWKTKDGAAWWLRDSRYNEPNGDYNANCFMDLWRPAPSEDAVQFNDGKCIYNSRSYYCQPIMKDKTRKKKKSRGRRRPSIFVPFRAMRRGLAEEYFFFKQRSKVPNLKGRMPSTIGYTRGMVNYGKGGKWPIGQRSSFAARWTGIMLIRRSGSYRFYVGSDDGSRLYINKKLVVNNDGRHGYKQLSGATKVNRIQARVMMTYFQAGGKQSITLKFKGPDTKDKLKWVSARALKRPIPKGWKEEVFYKKNMKSVPDNLKTLMASNIRVVRRVLYKNTANRWPGFKRSDDFAVYWTGKIDIIKPGKYRFQLRSDDGSVLYVKDKSGSKKIADNDGLHGYRGRFGDRKMNRGRSAILKCMYFERGGSAGMALYYMGPDTRQRLIPVPSRVMEAIV